MSAARVEALEKVAEAVRQTHWAVVSYGPVDVLVNAEPVFTALAALDALPVEAEGS